MRENAAIDGEELDTAHLLHLRDKEGGGSVITGVCNNADRTAMSRYA